MLQNFFVIIIIRGTKMEQQNLEKSIILLGPSCVGKTLISEQLAKTLGYPVISVDDLILLVGEEMDGCIGPSRKQQKWFLDDLRRQMLISPEFKEMLINPKYVNTQEKLIQQLVDFYNFYRNILGDLKPFYSIIEQNRQSLSSTNTSDYMIASLNNVTNQILQLVFEKVDQPLIIDPPGSYGWQFLKHLESDTKVKLGLNLKLRPTQTQKYMNDIISSVKSVTLLPGQDYESRNSVNDSSANQLINTHLDDFIETDVEISCNSLFYPTDSKYLKQRKLLDAREYLTKQQLKDNGEISNICDQILTLLNDLNQTNNL